MCGYWRGDICAQIKGNRKHTSIVSEARQDCWSTYSMSCGEAKLGSSNDCSMSWSLSLHSERHKILKHCHRIYSLWLHLMQMEFIAFIQLFHFWHHLFLLKHIPLQSAVTQTQLIQIRKLINSITAWNALFSKQVWHHCTQTTWPWQGLISNYKPFKAESERGGSKTRTLHYHEGREEGFHYSWQ